MSRERDQVLELLADGKITAAEAAQLLDRLVSSRSESRVAPGGESHRESHGASHDDFHGGSQGESHGAHRGRPTDDSHGGSHHEGSGAGSGERAPEKPRAPKYLRVLVDSADGDRVNVRVPLELIRTGIRLQAMLPEHAREQLDQKGIDLSQLGGLEGEKLVAALRELTVDVDSADGDTVRVFCE